MPYYVELIRIDLHVDDASPELRRALSAASDDLEDTDHTYETFEERLTLFAEAHPDAVVDALVQDGFRVRWFFHARAGKVTVRDVYPVLADIDHDARIAGIESEYGDEADLIADVDRASNAYATGTMVVDIESERYLVQLANGAASVHKAYPADPALFERLMS